MSEEEDRRSIGRFYLAFGFIFIFILMFSFSSAIPTGPDGIDYNYNSTKNATSAKIVNISGGYISSFNLTASVQNSRWKAFVGEVIGTFTLDDATGNTIYDWTLGAVTGRIYATRNSSTPLWSNIACASTANLEAENTAINHNGVYDNITATFNDTNHGVFWVGSVSFSLNQCSHTVNTYVGGTSTADFEEVALYDGVNLVYASILEQDSLGYDGSTYDFQMIVPEDGTPGYSGVTAYYLYVELD